MLRAEVLLRRLQIGARVNQVLLEAGLGIGVAAAQAEAVQ